MGRAQREGDAGRSRAQKWGRARPGPPCSSAGRQVSVEAAREGLFHVVLAHSRGSRAVPPQGVANANRSKSVSEEGAGLEPGSDLLILSPSPRTGCGMNTGTGPSRGLRPSRRPRGASQAIWEGSSPSPPLAPWGPVGHPHPRGWSQAEAEQGRLWCPFI